jgi:hypothetical protein
VIGMPVAKSRRIMAGETLRISISNRRNSTTSGSGGGVPLRALPRVDVLGPE